MSDGITRAVVATMLPAMDAAVLKPALCMAAYPQYVAEFMPMGPGVICDIATMLVNSADVSQWCSTTVWVCMSDSMP